MRQLIMSSVLAASILSAQTRVTLKASNSTSASVPWMTVDRLELSPAQTGPEQKDIVYTLSKTPVNGSALLAFILGGQILGTTAGADVKVTSGRDVVITLPKCFGGFQSGDVVLLVYLTTDPRTANQ